HRINPYVLSSQFPVPQFPNPMPRLPFVVAFLPLAALGPLSAQPRSLVQDSTLDNLRHPTGYQTAAIGTLGAVIKVGTGPRTMILMPGLGFGGGIFDDFMARYRDQFTMYAVTLPGFGGTAALPIPGVTSFGEVPWTKSAEQAILALMSQQRITRA